MPRFIPYSDEQAAAARSQELWEAARGDGWQPGNVTTRLYFVRVRVGEEDSDADLPPGVNVALQIPDNPHRHLNTLIREDELTADEMIHLVGIYPDWSETAVSYTIGDIVEHGLQLWKCIQAHTSQISWVPPAVPALWQPTVPSGIIPIYDSGLIGGYALDDLVIWPEDGRIWKSLQNANVFEPGAVGTWRDQSLPPIWVQPAGAIGLWHNGDVAEHNGQNWQCTIDNNAFEPGISGWVTI